MTRTVTVSEPETFHQPDLHALPAPTRTPANRAAIPGADYGSWPKIPDIARAYLFLASPLAALVNGAALPV